MDNSSVYIINRIIHETLEDKFHISDVMCYSLLILHPWALETVKHRKYTVTNLETVRKSKGGSNRVISRGFTFNNIQVNRGRKRQYMWLERDRKLPFTKLLKTQKPEI